MARRPRAAGGRAARAAGFRDDLRSDGATGELTIWLARVTARFIAASSPGCWAIIAIWDEESGLQGDARPAGGDFSRVRSLVSSARGRRQTAAAAGSWRRKSWKRPGCTPAPARRSIRPGRSIWRASGEGRAQRAVLGRGGGPGEGEAADATLRPRDRSARRQLRKDQPAPSATEIFIREGLVNDTIDLAVRFSAATTAACASRSSSALTRARHGGYLNLDEALYRFYAARI